MVASIFYSVIFGVKMIFLKLKYIKEKFLDRKNGIAKMH